jgi:hypothetical protein
MPLPKQLDPESEAPAIAAVRDAEEKEARDDKAFEAEVQRRVNAEIAAMNASKNDKVQTEIVNQDGVLTADQIAAREAKRANAHAAKTKG